MLVWDNSSDLYLSETLFDCSIAQSCSFTSCLGLGPHGSGIFAVPGPTTHGVVKMIVSSKLDPFTHPPSGAVSWSQH